MNAQSAIVSIDPELPHRGVLDTGGTVTKLLRHLNLQDMVVRVTGYSLHKSISNDGIVFCGYDPYEHFDTEDAPEFALSNLLRLLRERVAFVLLDGNHEPDYLRDEIRVAVELLIQGGVILIDDVDWPELGQEWHDATERYSLHGFQIGTRTGVLRKA
jgi:hypothetical protein